MAVALQHPLRARPREAPARTAAAASTVLAVRGLRLRSVAAFALVFLLGGAGLALGSGLAGWYLAVRWGFIDRIETLMVDLGFETFEVDGERMREALLVAAGVGIVVGTVLAVLAAALFNVVNRATGGIQVKVFERPERASGRAERAGPGLQSDRSVVPPAVGISRSKRRRRR